MRIPSYLIAISTCVLMSFQGPDILCDQKALKEKASEALEPYTYDSSQLTRLQYKNKESIKEIDVSLFIGEKYRMVFNTEALPKRVEVNVYNKDKDSKNRKLLFSSKSIPAGTTLFTFEPTMRLSRAYVDYVIPPTDSSAFTGCVVFMLGYK